MTRRALMLTTVATLVVLSGLWLRPPGPGHVYRHNEVNTQGATSTYILLERKDCLTLSQSEEDIGLSETGPETVGRTYAIAAAKTVISERDENGSYIVDKATGQRARPGDGIDGDILRMRDASPLEMFMSLAWLYDDRCGAGVALIQSIERAHD